MKLLDALVILLILVVVVAGFAAVVAAFTAHWILGLFAIIAGGGALAACWNV